MCSGARPANSILQKRRFALSWKDCVVKRRPQPPRLARSGLQVGRCEASNRMIASSRSVIATIIQTCAATYVACIG
jgi:hypothetical protein